MVIAVYGSLIAAISAVIDRYVFLLQNFFYKTQFHENCETTSNSLKSLQLDIYRYAFPLE